MKLWVVVVDRQALLIQTGTSGANPAAIATSPGAVFSYKLRYIVGFWLVEMVISTNQKPTIYRNLYENTGPAKQV